MLQQLIYLCTINTRMYVSVKLFVCPWFSVNIDGCTVDTHLQ